MTPASVSLATPRRCVCSRSWVREDGAAVVRRGNGSRRLGGVVRVSAARNRVDWWSSRLCCKRCRWRLGVQDAWRPPAKSFRPTLSADAPSPQYPVGVLLLEAFSHPSSRLHDVWASREPRPDCALALCSLLARHEAPCSSTAPYECVHLPVGIRRCRRTRRGCVTPARRRKMTSGGTLDDDR
jgi:hypothetical protein